MMLCVVCGGADKANILELSGQLPGQFAMPRVIIITLNNDILSILEWCIRNDFPSVLSVLNSCCNLIVASFLKLVKPLRK